MNKDDVFKILYDKDKVDVYQRVLQIEEYAHNSNDLYAYFDYFLSMLLDDRSYVRVRGFKLICILSKHDKNNKINENIKLILNLLNDDKPIVVRQCLNALIELINNKPELVSIIKEQLNKLDYMKYKDSMSPLVKKDIDHILSIC